MSVFKNQFDILDSNFFCELCTHVIHLRVKDIVVLCKFFNVLNNRSNWLIYSSAHVCSNFHSRQKTKTIEKHPQMLALYSEPDYLNISHQIQGTMLFVNLRHFAVTKL